jgi:PAS domain S-box-containing protein
MPHPQAQAACPPAAPLSAASPPPQLGPTEASAVALLARAAKCFLLTDPALQGNPIVFASPAFYELTGYGPTEVIGRNCRFLQGPGTDPAAVAAIRAALAAGTDVSVTLLNYRKDGTPFWNHLHVAPLRDGSGNITSYVGIQAVLASNNSPGTGAAAASAGAAEGAGALAAPLATAGSGEAMLAARSAWTASAPTAAAAAGGRARGAPAPGPAVSSGSA